MSKSFEELLRQRAQEKKAAASVQTDWTARLKWWIEQTNELYALIRAAVKTGIDEGLITCEIEPVEIFESQFGDYTLEVMTLAMGEDRLRIKPRGSVVIGAYGRVDVDGPAGGVMLILATDSISDDPVIRRNSAKWCVADEGNNRTNLRELNESVFQQVFADLMRLTPQ